ncbi:hypothetical protein TNCV_1335511 [Trichonephila clavipes]|nr:hypothetical protein TNCV_1335511 [Trichonephila clavipes]
MDLNIKLQVQEEGNIVKDIDDIQPFNEMTSFKDIYTEECGLKVLNDDEIVTSVQEESDPVDDETDEDEDDNESSKGPTNADAFSELETTVEWYASNYQKSYSTTAAQENQRPCREKTKEDICKSSKSNTAGNATSKRRRLVPTTPGDEARRIHSMSGCGDSICPSVF